MSAESLARGFIELTEDMEDLAEQKKKISAERDQVALELTRTGLTYRQIGRMTGVSAPLICRLAKKARGEWARGE